MLFNKFIKQLFIFVTLFLLTLVLIQFADKLRGQNIVFTFDSNRPDNIEIFYPGGNNSLFREENSERYAYVKGEKTSIAFSFSDSSRVIRINFFDGAGDLLLREVEINKLFAKENLHGKDLIARLRTTNSNQKFEMSNENILITRAHPNSSILIDLSNIELKYNYFSIFLIAILIALPGYCLFGLNLQLSSRRNLSVFIIPFLLTLVIVYVFFPGYMSYDSFHALRAARDGVTESVWPPMVSYVWRGVEAIYPHPSAMFFAQVFLLFLSTSLIIFKYTNNVKYVVISLVLPLFIPVILGTVSVIWKDVLMASFFIASFYFMVKIKGEEQRTWKIYFYSLVSLSLLFLATASRHNAVTTTFPLAFYLAWLLTGALNIPRRLTTTLFAGMTILVCVLGLKIQFDRYSIPELKPISGATDQMRTVKSLDIIAASICSDENLFGATAPSLSIQEMTSSYDARHSNLSLNLINKIPKDADIDSAWMNAFKKHPVCFFSNKALLTMYMLGLNSGDQFIITAPSVDFNEYGYYLPKNSLRQSIENYIILESVKFYFRPWFLMLLSITAILFNIYLRKYINPDYIVLWTSATFYAFGLFLFGNAADARLLFYTNYVYCLIFLLVVFDLAFSRIKFQKPPS